MKINLGRDFWIYRIGQLISVIGDGCINIGFIWWVLDKTNSAADASLVLFPAMFVRVFLLPLFGPIGDKFARKHVAFLGDFWRFICDLILGILALYSYFHLNILVILFIANAIGSALHSSVSFSIVPQLVPRDDIPEAIKQSQMFESFGNVAGYLLGGALVSLLGYGWAFIFNAITFLIAAFATLCIKANTTPSVDKTKYNLSLWFSDIKKGLNVLRKIKIEFHVTILLTLVMIFTSSLNLGLPLLAKNILSMPPWFLGLLNVSLGVGSLLGALFLTKIRCLFSWDKLIVSGYIIVGIVLSFLSWNRIPFISIALMSFAGMASAIALISISTQSALAIPDTYRSRIDTLTNFMKMMSNPIGMAVFGIAFTSLGFSIVTQICAIAVMVIGIMHLYVPHFKEFYQLSPKDASNFFIQTYPGCFK